MLRRYLVKFFSIVDWKSLEFALLAQDEAQVRAWADKECDPKFRNRDGKGDSLKIEDKGEVTLPFQLDDSWL